MIKDVLPSQCYVPNLPTSRALRTKLLITKLRTTSLQEVLQPLLLSLIIHKQSGKNTRYPNNLMDSDEILYSSTLHHEWRGDTRRALLL